MQQNWKKLKMLKRLCRNFNLEIAKKFNKINNIKCKINIIMLSMMMIIILYLINKYNNKCNLA